jgi:hypothetical protein
MLVLLLAGSLLPACQESGEDFFPVGVWLQDPRHAKAYAAAGINTYVGLWNGPTPKQLDALRAAGMRVVCAQNEAGLARGKDPLILAWMHGDEPDNAQPKAGGGYGPPVPPERIVEDYRRLKAADPDRPVLLNLGQGVAWDDWIGRGVRTRHPEDYPRYLEGCDLASFDIYPAAHAHPDVAGRLWLVPHGVERLRGWVKDAKPVWVCIEASRIDHPEKKITPAQLRSLVWMSLVHGARGLIYFVHQFKPSFIEASLLQDPDLLRAVTDVNREVRTLARVLNTPVGPGAVRVSSPDPGAPLAATLRRTGSGTYVFAVGLRDRAAHASFAIPGAGAGRVEVLGESRELPMAAGGFEDEVPPFGVRLYRIR